MIGSFNPWLDDLTIKLSSNLTAVNSHDGKLEVPELLDDDGIRDDVREPHQEGDEDAAREHVTIVTLYPCGQDMSPESGHGVGVGHQQAQQPEEGGGQPLAGQRGAHHA